MRVTNVDKETLERALERSHANLRFSRAPTGRGDRWTLDLWVKDVRDWYALISPRGRRLVQACWHGHVDWPCSLYQLAPDADFVSGIAHYENAGDFKAKMRAAGRPPLSYWSGCECNQRGWRMPDFITS